MNNYKLIRFYPNIKNNSGGMENHIRRITELQKKKFKNVILIFNSGEKVDNSDISVLPFFKLSKLKLHIIYISIYYLFVIIKIYQRRLKTEVIHLHGDWTSYIYAPIIKFLTSAKRTIFSFHGSINNHNAFQKYFLKKSLSYADVIFVNGYQSFCVLRKYEKSKIYFMPSGVDDFFFNKKINIENILTAKKICLTVCNFFPVKNLTFVIDIAKDMQDVDFHIIGDGPEFDLISNKIKIESVDNVYLLGKKNKFEISCHMQNSSLFLLTSYSEGTPTVILEAMAVGLPIVSSNAGGINHIIHDEVNGIIISDYNKKNYINAIYKIFKNDCLYTLISKNNIEKSKQFNWQIIESSISEKIFITLICFIYFKYLLYFILIMDNDT